MLLFKKDLVPLIIEKRKCQTRRVWKRRRIRPGSMQKAKTQMLSSDWFAVLPITRVWRQRLGNITEHEANAEGFSSLVEFKDYWTRLHGNFDPDLEVFAVEWDTSRMVVNNQFGDESQ
jgi:hypothetical protein